MERYGFAPYKTAKAWMRQNKGRNVNTPIGGVLDVGVHKVVLVERITGGQYDDLRFKSRDSDQYHTERVWGNWKAKFDLGSHYQVTLAYKGDIGYSIEFSQGLYKLKDPTDEVIYASPSVREVYGQANQMGIRIPKLSIIHFNKIEDTCK